VEKGERIYAFALNTDIHDPRDIDNRVPLGMACLRRLGIIPTLVSSVSAP
jgi:beta-lactamase class D